MDSMKRFYLLKLNNFSNQVIDECEAENKADAIARLNMTISKLFPLGKFQLDSDGYMKYDAFATYCVAEKFESIHY